jgi:hypothetical protein
MKAQGTYWLKEEGRLSLTEEQRAKMLNPIQPTLPIPHYPLWRFFCPQCGSFWESEKYHESYFTLCPDCSE